VPDNLTRYRVMAVAVAGERNFGAGESNITARMPLMVRPSPPRFLNFGDRFELPVVVQNQTGDAMTVRVAVRSTNAAITDGLGRSVTVPANDRVEVRFPAAAEMPGIARFQVGASAGRWADASEFALPVWTPATTEAFATYGEIDDGALRQPVAMPRGVVKEFGGLEITTSSTQLQALTDAFLYLINYPFECAEQTSSRVIAIAALRDVLTAFEAREMPAERELIRTVERDIDRLRGLQNHDGGFAFWVRGHESWPYISIHAANALVRAKAKGFAVPQEMLDRSRGYLRNIERHIPWYYGPVLRRTLVAYSLHVRRMMGDPDTAKARSVMAEAGLGGLSMEGVGWLLATMTGDQASASQLAEIRKYLKNRVSETAATANWTTSYSDGAHLMLHSDRRADGVILEAMIQDQPKSDLIPKVTRGLLAHRKRGRWSNTQENSFVLLAMDRYFHAYESVTPNFVARLWLGDEFAGEQSFKGRQTKHHQLDIPMAYLAGKGQQDLVLAKQGKGRLYYRVGMTYAPEDLSLPPADHGFAVERVYEPVDDPGDVVRQKDGTWKIKAGALVRVRLTMVAVNRRYHVALVDPLPAGLEPMNPALAVTGTVPQDPKASEKAGRYWWWWRTWYEHQNMRDERVEAFTSLLWEGVHTYTYVARATTPGHFVVPPTKAEEMYFPETFGRARSDKVIVQ
jgi:alpha-2-macroglobulin